MRFGITISQKSNTINSRGRIHRMDDPAVFNLLQSELGQLSVKVELVEHGRVGNWRGGLTTPSPVPATSNGACGFPALRSPARFEARVMRLRPGGPLSGLMV